MAIDWLTLLDPKKNKTGGAQTATGSTSPWLNNFSSRGKKYDVNIPDLQANPTTGVPIVPKEVFQTDSEIPWNDLRYDRSVDKIVGAGSQYAFGLADVEEQRGQRAEDLVRGALNETDKPSMSQGDIDRMFGAEADRASSSFIENIGALRDMLGGAGITGGGLPAALASQMELTRQGQITDARRSLMIEKSKMDAADRMRKFNNSLTLAQIVARSPSAVGLDWLNQILQLRLSQGALERQDHAATEAAKAAGKAGTMSMIGQIGGALIGAI